MNAFSISLHRGRGDTGVDSTKAIVVLHSEESALSPVSSPGVLDEPEVLRLAVSDQKDSVVRSAVGAVIWSSSDDSRGVREEEISIEGDGQGSVGDQVGHNLSDISAEGSPVRDRGHAGLSRLASSVFSGVGIVSLISESVVVDDILVGEPGKSSTASSVAEIGLGLEAAVRAINDPLLRQGDELLLGQEPLSFNVLCSRESPARTAAGLVLNWGDSSLLSPVP